MMMKLSSHNISAAVVLLIAVGSLLAAPVVAPAAGYFPTGDWPSVSRLTQPAAVAVDPLNGEVYVADTGGRRIAVYDSTGTFLHEFDGRDAIGARLEQPAAIMIGADTRVYVADRGTQRIAVFEADGSFVHSFGGAGSAPGRLSGPSAVAWSADGNVVVADRFNNRIQVFNPSGAFVRVVPIVGLEDPAAIAVAGGDLYVAEGFRRRVRCFNLATGAFVREWGLSETLNGPTKSRYSAALKGLAFDGSDVYVSDGGVGDPPDNRPPIIERVSPTLSPLSNVVATASGFAGQGAIAVQAGQLYVADTQANRVVSVAVASMPPSTLPTLAPQPTGSPEYQAPKVVTCDVEDGSLYVAEHGANRIRKFDAAGEYLLTFEQPTPPLSRPSGILAGAGPLGEVYVSDTGNNRLLAYSPDGELLATIGSAGSAAGEFLEPKGLTRTAAGYVGVVDAGNKRVQLLIPAQYEGDAYGAPAGQAPFGDASALSSPTALVEVETNAGYRYLVTDQGYRRISVFNSDGVYLQGSNITGSSSGQFVSPQGICIGPDGESVLVADAGTHRIEQFGVATLSPMATIGSPGYSPGGLTSPHSVTLAPDRTLVVADTGNDRVVRFGYDTTPPVVTVTGDVDTWINRVGTIALSVSDSESGVSNLEYMGSDFQWRTYSGPIPVSGEGIRTIAYRATDVAGNVFQSGAQVWIDTVMPTGTTTFAAGKSSARSGDVPVVSSVSDAGSGIADMRLGTPAAPGEWVPYSASGSINVSGVGPKTLQAQYRDRAGNVSTVTRSIDIDDSGPVTNISGLPVGTYAPGAVTLTVSAEDAYSPVASVRYRVDGGSESSAANGAQVTVSGNGLHSITAWAVDSLGNIGEPVVRSFRISELSAGGTLSLAGGAPVVGTRTVSVTTTAKGATEVKWRRVGDSAPAPDFGPIPGSWQVTFPDEGPHELEATFRDVNGYELTLKDAVTVDLSPPETGIIGVPSRGGSLTPVSLSFSASDKYSRVPVTYYSVDGGPLQTYVHTSPATRFEVAGNGTHTITFYSVDEFGNTESQRSTQFVIDDDPAEGTFSVVGASGEFVGGRRLLLELKTPYVSEVRHRVENGAWSPWQPWSPLMTVDVPYEGIVQIEVDFRSIFGEAKDFGWQRRVKADWTAPVVASAGFAPTRFTLSKGVMRVDLRGTASGLDPAALLGPPAGVDSWTLHAGRRQGTVLAQAGVTSSVDVAAVGRGYNRVSMTLIDKVGNIGVKGGLIKVGVSADRPKVPSSARRNRGFTVSGTVPVAGAGAAHAVQVYKRDSSGRWVLVRSHVVKPSISGSTARLAKRIVLGRGSYRVVMYSAAGMRQVLGRPSAIITVK